MEDKQMITLDSANENQDNQFKISLPKSGERECYVNIGKSLIKLLYMIEDEQKDPNHDIKLWFYSFMLDLISSNALCHEKLTKVIVKIHALYDKEHYKEMSHAQIKRQIFESKGIVDYLIKELDEQKASDEK